MVEPVSLRPMIGDNHDQDAVAIGDLYRQARLSTVDSARCLLEAGQRLAAKKERVGHGGWLLWLKDNADTLGFETSRTAQMLMRAVTKYEAGFAFDVPKALEISRDTWGHVSNDGKRGTRGNGENEWFTPTEHIEAARAVLGEIDLNPASHVLAQETVKALQHYTRENDGLSQEWRGRVWLNPPYGRDEISLFVEKLTNEIECGNTTAAIMITHNYSDTEWFHMAVARANALCFTLSRIKFISDSGKVADPTQGQVFFYYGSDVESFKQTFGKFGFIVLTTGIGPRSRQDRKAVERISSRSAGLGSTLPLERPE